MRPFRIGASAPGLAILGSVIGVAILVTASPALAHTSQTQGPYTLTFGWANEPCYTSAENAVQLFIHQGGVTGTAVANARGLTVQVSAGGATSPPLALNNALDPDTGLGNPAEYDAPLIPTIPGPYTFHITGTINGTRIDVSATSSDSTFDSAHDPSGVEFPTQPPTNATLAQAVVNLRAQVTGVQASASRAKTLAYVALGAAVVAALLGIAAGTRRTRTRSRKATSRSSGGGDADQAPR